MGRRIQLEAGVPGAGCLRLLFVPSLALGVLAMAGALMGAAESRIGGGQALLTVVCGASMALPSLFVLGVRGSTELDLDRGLFVRIVRLFGITIRRRETAFARLTEVGVERVQYRRSVLFPVVVRGEREIEVGRRASAQEARELGERVARVVRRPLRDRGLEREVLRGSDELDVPLRARLGRVPMPPGRPSHIRQIDAGTFEIPASGVRIADGALLAMIGMLTLSMWAAVVLSARAGRTGDAIGAAGFALLLTPWLVYVYAIPILRLASTRHVLRIDRHGVRVESSFFGSASGVHLGPDEIEEIVLVREADRAPRVGRVLRRAELVIRGDRAAISVGRGLPEDDLRWLRQHVLHGLAGSR